MPWKHKVVYLLKSKVACNNIMQKSFFFFFLESQKLSDCLKFYHIFAPANLKQRFTVAQILFNLHTHSELYFYLPDSALIYDFILVQNLGRKKRAENQKLKCKRGHWTLPPAWLDQHLLLLLLLHRLVLMLAAHAPARAPAWAPAACVCDPVGHNSKLELCCLPIAGIASRVFIWLFRYHGKCPPRKRSCHVDVIETSWQYHWLMNSYWSWWESITLIQIPYYLKMRFKQASALCSKCNCLRHIEYEFITP